jgi:hypothetical protein
MAKKWIGASIALLVVALLLGRQLYVSVQRFNAENDPQKIQPKRDLKQKKALEGELRPPQPPKKYNAADFAVIPAQNLFSEFRGKTDPAETVVVQEVAELKPRPVLVGVALAGNQRFASIIDPSTGAGAGAGRRTQTKRVGDVYQGYTIVDITPTQIVMQNGTRREIIPLFDLTKQKTQGGKTPIIASRVVRFGGGGAGAAGTTTPATSNVAVAGRAAGATPAAAVTTVIGGSTQPQPGQTAANPAAMAPGPQGARPTPAGQPQPPRTWNELTDDQGRRIIRTPFGDIVRDKPNN